MMPKACEVVLFWRVPERSSPTLWGIPRCSAPGQVLTGKWLLFVPEWRVDDLLPDLPHTVIHRVIFLEDV